MAVVEREPNRDYANAAQRNISYVVGAKGSKAPNPTADYAPQTVLGICTRCKRIGSVAFPRGTFKWDIGDKLMDRRQVVIHCPQCNCNTYFLPVPLGETAEAMKWLEEQEKKLKQRELGGRPDPLITKALF